MIALLLLKLQPWRRCHDLRYKMGWWHCYQNHVIGRPSLREL